MKRQNKTERIYSALEIKIKSGQWSDGALIPTQRELAALFEVNRSTIVSVLDQLKSAGLIESFGRYGTRVAALGWNAVTSHPSKHWDTTVRSGFHKANQPIIQTINSLEFDESYIRLGTGELSPALYPKNAMSQVTLKAMAELDAMRYECPKGSLRLRTALSTYLMTKGIAVTPENILIVSGSLQGLQLISIGLMSSNAVLLSETPSYVYSLNTFQSVGIQFKGIPLDDEGISISHLLIHLPAQKTSEQVLYTIPNFHNPTGTLMTQNRRESLIQICERHKLPIIEDDAYCELWLDAPPPPPLKSMDRFGNVLYLGTFSKSLAAGLRIGWVVGPEAVIERLGDIKMQLDYGASSLSQAVAAECLESEMYTAYTENLRQVMRTKRAWMLHLLEKDFSGICSWTVPSGGFYIWLRLPDKIPSSMLFHQLLAEKVLLNPGDIYADETTHHLRLSYGYATEEQLTTALIALKKVLLTLVG